MTKFISIISSGGSGGGSGQGWTYYDLTSADGFKDPNSLRSSGPTYSGLNVNTISIDRNQGGAVLDPDDVLFYYWDTGLTAEDDFPFVFDLEFTDKATMASSNIAVWAGLTSDINDMNTYSYGAGANWQLANLRGWRVKGTVRSVGGLGTSRDGVKCTCIRAGGTNTGTGNVANDFRFQALDGNGDGVNSYYGVSNSFINANAGSDKIYFFIAFGVITAAASVDTVEFKIKVAPMVKDDI